MSSDGATPWWFGVGRAEARVECAGEQHRIVWERGELLAVDHNDIDAERALVALGGEACECAALLETWARHASDPRLLVLGPRSGSDQIERPGEDRPQGWAQAPPSARAMPRAGISQRVTMLHRATATGATFGGSLTGPGASDDEAATSDLERIVALLALGGGIPRRLLAAVAEHHRADATSASKPARATFHAALYGRLLAALGTWLGPDAERLELAIITEAEAPSLRYGQSGTVEARLPFGWLVDIWGRGTETFWDRFCLSAGTKDGRVWELLTVGPDLGPPGVTRIELPS